jgi:hypothetical protein
MKQRIDNIDDLIEHLEVLRAYLQPCRQSATAYHAIGWADRPLRQLIDQCRQEQEAQSWAAKHGNDFRALLESAP